MEMTLWRDARTAARLGRRLEVGPPFQVGDDVFTVSLFVFVN